MKNLLIKFGVFSLLMLMPVGWAELNDTGYHMDDNIIKHFHQGQSWMEIGRFDLAIREFQMGIELKPSALMTATLYNNLGLTYLKVNETGKAIVSFEEAIQLNPQFSLYYENLAKAYQQAGTLTQAIQQVKGDSARSPDNPQALYLLGTLYRQAGQASAAKATYQKYLKVAPYTLLAEAAKRYAGASP
jgi:tetratricopeptide (TPR) repeat protein